MKKIIKFISITVWIIISRAYDVYATSQFTPDLSKEANPLVSIFGLNWGPLLFIITGILLYTFYTLYINTFKKYDLLPAEKGLKFSEFMTYVYLGKKDSWLSILYKFPKDIKRLNYLMGYWLSRTLVFAGILSTVMWLLINYTDFYYPKFHRTAVLYSILIIGALVIWIDFYKKLYKKSYVK
jgi:hypothetical protein